MANVPLFPASKPLLSLTLHFTIFRVKWVQSGYSREGYGQLGARQVTPGRRGVQGGYKGFTATRIATLLPGRYKDPGQKSLYLLVRDRQDGKLTRTWLHRIKFKGADTFLQLGHFPETSLEEARNDIRDQRELLAKGIDPRQAAPRRTTRRSAQTLSSAATAITGSAHSIETLVHEFLERYVKPSRKRPEYAKAIFDRDVLTEQAWKGRDARTIKPREVIELLDRIVERGSKVMANRTAALLSQLFRFGVHRAIVETSPVQLLMRPGGKEKPRDRTLTDDELKAFLADPREACRFPRLAHVILILLLTGQRRGELALARWREVDFRARSWTIPPENSKTGRGHVVPLSDWAVEEFRLLKKAAKRSPWVLPASDPTLSLDAKLLTRGLAKCQKRFGKLAIEPFTLHDLRRTCRTGLAKLRVEPHIAERVLNHAQERIPGTYDVHDYLDEKRAALDQWAERLHTLRP
jgi:integrase